MGFKKKKNIIILSSMLAICFFVYQLYFFSALSAENYGSRVIHVIDHSDALVVPLRSEDDKYINEHGVLRGVLSTNMLRYRPDSNNQYKCLTSSEFIPFEQVNDDYCDCEDSSDEPSTNACTNGTFYCDTQYQSKPLNRIPSNMVNDGICDCCDGSDEWRHNPNQDLLTQGSGKLRRHYAKRCSNICFKNL